MHLSPAEGEPRDVAGAIIDRLYPPGMPARIPVVAVTGTNGKTTTVRMISQILRQAGLRAGMASTDGVYAAGRMIYQADASGPRSAEMVLDDPAAEAAVLETARGGILRRGLGYDRADVAVITNITADHLGADGVADLDELIEVKALVAEEIRDGGTVVLNADDLAVAALAGRRRWPGTRRTSGTSAWIRAARCCGSTGRQAGSATSCGTASWSRPRATGSARWPRSPVSPVPSAGWRRIWWRTRLPLWPPAVRSASARRTSGAPWRPSRPPRPIPAAATCTGRPAARSSWTTGTTPPRWTRPAP